LFVRLFVKVRVVVLYSMYEACQIAWSLWLYDKPLPDGMQLEVNRQTVMDNNRTVGENKMTT
jgi:hypothetical protein